MTCKTWSLLAEKYFNPLCTNRFYSPESCPICVAPLSPATSNVCGCPSGQTEGPRSYILTVVEGPLGHSIPWTEWYGSFRLSNRGVDGSYGCGGGVSFVAASGPLGQWNIIPSSDIVTVSGKTYRYISVRAEKKPNAISASTAVITWSVPTAVPACANRDRFRASPIYVRVPSDESPGTNPFYPDVEADHFGLTLAREY